MAGEIDLSQFHEVFFEEAFEGLATMESGLLDLDPAEPNQETINNVFRAAHSIKGGAATFGFGEVAEFTHVMETLLDDVRGEQTPVTDDLIQLLLESVDFLKHLLQECQAGRIVPEEQVLSFASRLKDYHVTAETLPAAGIEEKTTTSDIWKIVFRPKNSIFKSGNDPYRIVRDLAGLGRLESRLDAARLPALADIEPEDCYLGWEIQLSDTKATEQDLWELFEWVEDEADITITSEVSATQIIEQPKEEIDEGEEPFSVTQKAAPEVTSIRVNIDRVDMLVNLAGELVITQSMLSRFKNSEGDIDADELIRGIEQLEENTRELQEQTMRIRMLPIDNVFQRMPRLVHDLCKTLGKEVDLVLKGKSTEVDKTVLEKISDPLTHLIRNCLDHGIETPELREKAGKPRTGNIEISAFHEGGSIIIEVKDDGRGFNRDAILAKAIEKGVVDPDAELVDHQIDQLVFSPGFSTAETVSDVSGRGVGMDVVKNNIEQLNGHIDVSTEPGFGSTITIRLPLTLAIIEGQLVRVGTDVFVIPMLSIVKSTRIDPSQYNLIGGESSMFRLEDDYIPIVSLKDVYRINADYESVSEAILVIVDVVERFGILVDEVLGQQQVVVKSLETNFKEVPTISGATILGDGTVAMILDMAGLKRESRTIEASA